MRNINNETVFAVVYQPSISLIYYYVSSFRAGISLGTAQSIPVIYKAFIYYYYVVLFTRLYDDYTRNSEVTCYTSWTFATILFYNI